MHLRPGRLIRWCLALWIDSERLATVWPLLSADFILIALGIASGPLFAVLTRWRWWTQTPFSFSFWSFSFPLAALASSIAEAVRRGGWPPEVALAAVLLASALVLFLALRTLIQLLQRLK